MDERSDREVPPAWRRRLARARHDLRSVWLERDDFPQALDVGSSEFSEYPRRPCRAVANVDHPGIAPRPSIPAGMADTLME